jgi:hypothetical protein
MKKQDRAICQLVCAYIVFYAVSVWADDYADHFRADTTARYLVTDSWVKGGVGQFLYDSAGQRLHLLTGDNVALQFSVEVFPTAYGQFEIDFLPSGKHPEGGWIGIRLVQDADNYYEIENTDGYGPGEVRTIVNGQKRQTSPFGGEYVQGNDYPISIAFHPTGIRVDAFGSAIAMQGGEIMVRRFEVEVTQQDAYFDNILFGARDPSSAASVRVRWDAVSDPGVVRGYKIYYGTGDPNGAYDGRTLLQGESPIIVPVDALADSGSPEYVLDWFKPGATYFIAVTAYDVQNNESGYSNKIVFRP